MVLGSGIKVSYPLHFNESFKEVAVRCYPLKENPYNLTIALPIGNFI